MSESSKHKPKLTTGAALRRGTVAGGATDRAPVSTPGAAMRRKPTHHPPPAAGAHQATTSVVGVSDTASSLSTSTHTRGKEFAPPVKLENTYRVEPYPDKKFARAKVRDMVSTMLQSYLSGEDYDQDRCPALTKDISQMIKKRVCEMKMDRYKIVVTVLLGENNGQGMQMVSRFLWNTNTDNYESITYKNKTLFAVASIFAVYFE